MDNDLNQLIEQVSEVCPLPSSTSQIMALANDPNARIEDVAEVVASDPSLAAEVMRIANSPLFGGSRQTSDLGRAIMMIGLNELHSMAMAMGMLAAFQTKQEQTFNFHDTAVLSGVIARTLAPQLQADKGQAFLAGLLCEIGAMACVAVDGAGFAQLWEGASEGRKERDRLEAERYGATTREVGGRLLDKNGLPELISGAIKADPTNDPDPLGRLTYFARAVAPLLVAAGKGETDFDGELAALKDEIGLTLDVATLHTACIESAQKTLSALSKN